MSGRQKSKKINYDGKSLIFSINLRAHSSLRVLQCVFSAFLLPSFEWSSQSFHPSVNSLNGTRREKAVKRCFCFSADSCQ